MNNVNQFPENLQNVANYILSNLDRIGESSNGVNYSSTDYGYSAYVYTNKSNFVDTIKFRISDHNCGDQRFSQEVCVNSIESAEMYFQSIEKKYYPERFDIVFTGQVINGIQIRQWIRK